MRQFTSSLLILLLLLFAGGCGVYYNTFYNAKKAFNEAEGERKSSKPGEAERIRTNLYEQAIDKSLKVVENHPNSKYYDDAVYVLGVSYFYTKQYAKAERRFREILANYPNTDFARDSRLYLAKSMLQQDAEEDAMDIFAELFESDANKQFKSEAALALGQYQFDEGNYALAGRYFLAVRDTLGNDVEKGLAQRYIADGLFAERRFSKALAAYLQILGMNPTLGQKYHALFRAAECSFQLSRNDDGQDYLNTLAKDELYFDSLAVLRLKMAEGYEWKEDYPQAEELYKQVVAEAPNKTHQAQANLALGLIYQYDYDNLEEAKKFYDAAVTAAGSSEAGRAALQLSSNIGKLETYARTVKIDSTTSKSQIDEAAYTQYLLAELYWFQLSKPDTAMIEMQYVVDSFPTAYDAPKAMIAMAQMTYELSHDTAAGDSILREMLERYPHSDFVPEALGLLGLDSTAADTGYAEYHIRRAENFLIDEGNVDSALAAYQVVVDSFPDSRFYLQAKFAQIWARENYASPGDSSILFAYQEMADSFPSSQWGAEAKSRLTGRPAKPVQQKEDDQPADTTADTTAAGEPVASEGDTTGAESDQNIDATRFKEMYTDLNGERVVDMPADVQIMETRKQFEYPTEAYVSKWEGELYFQIRLDFSGEVAEIAQKSFSPINEIDLRAAETVQSMVFDINRIPPQLLDKWFMYKFKVILPSHLR